MTTKRRRRNKRRVLSRKDRDDVCVAVEPEDFLFFFGSFFSLFKNLGNIAGNEMHSTQRLIHVQAIIDLILLKYS